MASTSGGSGHGGKRVISGRKRKVEDRGEYKKAWLRNHKHIYVEEKIFKLWLQVKFDAGYHTAICLVDVTGPPTTVTDQA